MDSANIDNDQENRQFKGTIQSNGFSSNIITDRNPADQSFKESQIMYGAVNDDHDETIEAQNGQH